MTSANVKYGEDFSIAGRSGKGAKSVDVKVGEIESGLKIEKDFKTGKRRLQQRLNMERTLVLHDHQEKEQNLLMLKLENLKVVYK